METMQILIMTSDKTFHALRAFAWCWIKYALDLADYPIDIYGYSPQPFPLPRNFTYHSIGKFEDFPAQRWSDGLYHALSQSEESVVLLLLDDYWLVRDLDTRAIKLAAHYVNENKNILRFDLSSDRLYAEGIQDAGTLGHLDLIESNPSIPYNLSLQAGLWNRKHLKDLLVSNESAWQFEMRGTERTARYPHLRVLGTRQVPMKYLIAVQNARLALDGDVPPVPVDTGRVWQGQSDHCSASMVSASRSSSFSP